MSKTVFTHIAMAIDQDLYPLLADIESPADLRALPASKLSGLTEEIRDYLVNTVDIPGGHFASSLGALELTLALHYCYQTPYDRLVWDVGHQGYIHKILTGRKEALQSVKQPGGIAGFPKRAESPYDTFGVGHASTSISAALGMSESARIKGEARKVAAIIGDGALTGGMSFEALNHAGGAGADLLVILNDNEMSISENVGALTHYFSKVLAGNVYHRFREHSKRVLRKLPVAWDIAKSMETQAKGLLLPANLFEAMGFYYIGPVDGHDVHALHNILANLRQQQGPRLLHVVTTKGKGYAEAEADPIGFHHVGPSFHSGTAKAAPKPMSYANVFGRWICDQAEADERLAGVTPAMREGSDLVAFSKRFPERYFDVAIAEQHAVTFSAGLACEQMKPVLAIYSTFLQRGYDQFIHDVCIQNLDVTFAIDRAGLVGADGPTHAGSFDLSYMRCIPNLMIAAPSDENECYHLLSVCYQYSGPAAVRYPRGSGPGAAIGTAPAIEPGKGRVVRTGHSLVIINFGARLAWALEAAEALEATVVDMRFVKPLDQELLARMATAHQYMITLEENALKGGAGSAVNEYLFEADLADQVRVRNIGLPDYFQDHGKPEQMLAAAGISASGIREAYASMQNQD